MYFKIGYLSREELIVGFKKTLQDVDAIATVNKIMLEVDTDNNG